MLKTETATIIGIATKKGSYTLLFVITYEYLLLVHESSGFMQKDMRYMESSNLLIIIVANDLRFTCRSASLFPLDTNSTIPS